MYYVDTPVVHLRIPHAVDDRYVLLMVMSLYRLKTLSIAHLQVPEGLSGREKYHVKILMML